MLFVTDIDSPRRSRAWIGWLVGALVVALLLCLGWIVIRGIGAVVALGSAKEDAGLLEDAVRAGELDAATTIARRMAADTGNAVALTTDPIWRGAEWVPGLGPNLSSIREVSEVTYELSRQAAPKMLDAASVLDLATLGISNGRIDLVPLAEAAPDLRIAASLLSDAEVRTRAIDAGGALPPIRDAVADLTDEISSLAHATGMLDGAAQLLPTMLGGEQPRTFLLLMQNNAELRSSGGIPGAMALLSTQAGAVSLGLQADTTQFRTLDEPIADLPPSVTDLFGELPATRIQDTMSPADFPRAAELAARVWTTTTAQPVDGVIAVDAVLIGRLLEATGPLTVAGVEITSENATDLLLHDIYTQLPDPAAQDAFFRETAASLFGALTDGSTDASAILGAFADAGDSGRVHVWSADDGEQAVILGTTLSGAIPDDSRDRLHVAVLANDSTGGKMDYYADAAVQTAIGTCAGRPTLQITVRWSSSAPEDAATALPAYVTANGWFGVPPGITGTRLAVVGPEGWALSADSADGEVAGTAETELDGRRIVQYDLRTPPGGSQTLQVEFTGPDAADADVVVHATPMIRDVPVSRTELRCG